MFEINLVPDVKAKALKTQKLRNVIIFFSGVVIAACVVVLLVLGGIKAGQDITMSSQDSMIEELSKKINSFGDLNNLLTIQKQLNGLDEIGENKALLSRVFSIIGTFLPTNGDEISLSSLNVDLDESVINFDAQADSRTEPFVDYVVLDAFKKNMGLMRYDYGKYVTEDGEEIPEVCVVETDEKGNILKQNGGVYAMWAKNVNGCDPANVMYEGESEYVAIKEEDVLAVVRSAGAYEVVWRTPQYKEWEENGFLDEGGTIEGVAHFQSECIKYGYDNVKEKWTSENVCVLAPEGVEIKSSSNARGTDGTLVLKFSATVKLDKEVFLAKNKHMISIAPSGYINVTDSFMQIEGMFEEAANECEEGDSFCDNDANKGGE